MLHQAVACDAAGLSFAGVHDSYWTHAGTTGTMNRILREQFIELHSAPLLEQLKEGLEQVIFPLKKNKKEMTYKMC